jgi:hypothetical protein
MLKDTYAEKLRGLVSNVVKVEVFVSETSVVRMEFGVTFKCSILDAVSDSGKPPP